MTLNLPEDFFRNKLAVHLPHEHIAEFIEACFDQYGHRTESNNTLLSWCLRKAENNRDVYIYHNRKFFTAFTNAYAGMQSYTIIQMEEVIQQEANMSDILALL